MADYPSSVVRGGVRAEIDAGLRAHMNKVYGLMSVAMIVTFAVAAFVGSNQALQQTIYGTPLHYVVMFAPLVAIFGLAAGIQRMSVSTASIVFYAFAAIMGLSIGWIFVVYDLGMIAKAFLSTSVAFMGLSLYGYTTKRDLTGVGRFAIMGLIGVIALMLINWVSMMFFGGGFGSAFNFVINVAVLLIFAALTAYDTQRIKSEYVAYAQHAGNPEAEQWLGKAAIMGALSLYLNFINMFMVVLQFMGGSRE